MHGSRIAMSVEVVVAVRIEDARSVFGHTFRTGRATHRRGQPSDNENERDYGSLASAGDCGGGENSKAGGEEVGSGPVREAARFMYPSTGQRPYILQQGKT